MALKLLLSFFFLLSLSAISQESYNEYYDSNLGKVLKFEALDKGKGKFILSLEGIPLESQRQKAGLVFTTEKVLESFVSDLVSVRDKYTEWKRVAVENEVQKASKKFELTAKSDTYFTYGRDTYFNFNKRIEFLFGIAEKGGEVKYTVVLNSGELQASSNRYIKIDGFVITFSSEEDFNDLISKLNKDKILNYLSQPKDSDLFKN